MDVAVFHSKIKSMTSWGFHETLKLLFYAVTIYNNVGNVLNLGTELFQHGSKNNNIRRSTQKSQEFIILLRWKAVCFDEWLSRSIEKTTYNWTLIVYHTQFLVKLQHKMMSYKSPTKPIPGFEPVGEALEILKAMYYIHYYEYTISWYYIEKVSNLIFNLQSPKKRQYWFLKMFNILSSTQELIRRIAETLVTSQCEHLNCLYFDKWYYWRLPWVRGRLWKRTAMKPIWYSINLFGKSPNQLNKINSNHWYPCHQPVLFPKSEYWDCENKKCLALGLCRPPIGQSKGHLFGLLYRGWE